jgi:hypothetical protein
MSLSKLIICVTRLLVCAVFFASAAQAQYRASIQGTVTDAQGAVVEGATLTLTAKETNISKTATSASDGIYAFSGLAPGHYSLAVQKTGFKKELLDDVTVTAEQANAVNVQLQVGQVTEAVTVSGSELPAIDTETGNVAGTLTSDEIQNLPSFGRDPYQLARLAPGVFGDGSTSGDGRGSTLPGSNQISSGSTGSIFMTENQPQIVAGGTRNNGNSYQVDGVEVNSLAWGGSAVITPNEEAVKEVQIQANPYSAENGRNSGAQVLVVTKNGTNDFHGSAFAKIHRPGLDAYQRWNGPFPGSTAPFGHLRDNNRFNQFGGSVGGPIFKNKLFFFYSMEQLRNVVNGSGPSGWYDTPQFDSLVASNAPSSIAAKFMGLPGSAVKFTQINPVTCAQAGLTEGTNCVTVKDSGGNIIGLNVGSPTNAALGTKSSSSLGGGLCNGTTIPCTPDIFNVSTLQSDRNIATQYNGRLDYQATSKDLVAFSIFWVPNNNDGFFNGGARTYNLWNSDRLNYSPTVLWDHTVNANILNEARFNVTRWWYNEVTSNPLGPFGFPAASILNLGFGEFGNGTCPFCGLFGPAGPGIFYQTTYNIRDTLTKIHRSHSLKFGTDIYKEQDNDETPWAGQPGYNFNNLWDFANDAPSQQAGDYNPVTGKPQNSIKHIRANIYSLFAQDDYRLKPNLTVNLGLRWEYFGPIHDKSGNFSTAALGPGTSVLTGLHMRLGGNLYNSSYHNFGPQIGFAWSPRRIVHHEFNNKFVVRGGFGIAYNRMQEAVTLNGRFNPPLDESFSYWSGTALTGSNVFYAVADNPRDFNGYPSTPAAVTTINPTTNLPACAPATCAAVGVTAFDANLPTPVVYRYSVEGQYDLGSHWVATVGYQGSQSRHFTRQINNLNWLYPNNLNPAVAGVDFYTNDANASYNALLTQIQHQFARTFSIDAQYVHSSCMDHGSQDYYSDPYPFNVNASLGHCDFDSTNAFKAFGIWSPRIFRGSSDWREKIVGGWELSGIYTFHSGFPFTPFFGGPLSCCNGQVIPAGYKGGAGSNYGNSTFEQPNGNFSQLASLTCSNANPCTSIPYFAIPTLTASGVPPFPGLQRNLFRGPRFHDFDFSMRKDFGLPHVKGLGEGAKISLRADFYNLFNTLNLSPISGLQHLGNLSFDSTTNTTTVTGLDQGFGRAGSAQGARVVEFQFRFQF